VGLHARRATRAADHRIASMINGFTGAAMLSFCDERALRLDDPVEQQVPSSRACGCRLFRGVIIACGTIE